MALFRRILIRNHHISKAVCIPHHAYKTNQFLYFSSSSFSTNESSKSPIEEEMQNIATGSSATSEPTQPISDEYDEIPEPPESGKRLFRDGLMIGAIAMIIGWSWTLYKKQRENYGQSTLTQIYSVRSHIEHALKCKDFDLRNYHLSEAEGHCRKALTDLGGGYLSNESGESEEQNIETYDAEIIALHVQLGKICYLLNKYQAAIDNYLVCLKALSQQFGYKSNELVLPCRQISDCYMKLGQHQMSQLFLERALKIIEHFDAESNKEYAPICQQMAVLFRKQYKWQKSIDFTNKAIKGAKALLGENHIQIAHMLLGRACAEMELTKYKSAEMSARNALKIIESHSQSTQMYKNVHGDDGNERILEGGIKNALKNKVKTNLMGYEQSDSERRYEEEMKRKRNMANSKESGVSSSEQLIEMKCSILFIIGQALIEQDRLNEAKMVFDNALVYATKMNDTTKQLLIHDQMRDIVNILKQRDDDDASD